MTSPSTGLGDGRLVLAPDRVSAQRLFAALLLTATTLPFLLAPLATGTTLITDRGHALLLSVLLVSGAHQPTFWYLYADRDSRSVVLGHPLFFFAAPLVILTGCVGFFLQAPAALHSYFWMAWGVLSIHHYQRQNLGVFGLLAPVMGGQRMSIAERRLITAGGVCGMLVFGYPFQRTIFQDTILFPLEPYLGNAAAAAMLVLIAATVAHAARGLAARDGARGPWLLRGGLLLLLVSYYWPLFVIEDRLTAFAMFACGHGFQYWIIMSYVATNNDRLRDRSRASPRSAAWLALAQLLLFGGVTWLIASGVRQIGVVLGGGAFASSGEEYASVATSLVLSVTLVHYWVDARMWKMSKPDSRRFMRKKLDFLF